VSKVEEVTEYLSELLKDLADAHAYMVCAVRFNAGSIPKDYAILSSENMPDEDADLIGTAMATAFEVTIANNFVVPEVPESVKPKPKPKSTKSRGGKVLQFKDGKNKGGAGK